VPAGEIAAFEALEPDFDLNPSVRIAAQSARHFLADLFCIPSFEPEIFDDESLVLPVHLSSRTYFTNC
jgi:hypothetical protein